MSIPHPIPYQGSKRSIASIILPFFPHDAPRLIEPFAGSAAIALAALHEGKVGSVVLSDANCALMHVWQQIVEHPAAIADAYEAVWMEQFGDERAYYDRVRDRFNCTHDPNDFLFLLTRCVKASVRYNARGEFNQSPDNRRKGTRPATMRTHILAASRLLSGRCTLRHEDYSAALRDATPEDVVYLDPPYQGVCGVRDSRYSHGLLPDAFAAELARLNANGVSYILSYDGRTGGKTFGRPLPATLGLTHLELEVGRSSQATLLGRAETTYESLYLSPALAKRLGEVRSATKLLTRIASPPLFEFGA